MVYLEGTTKGTPCLFRHPLIFGGWDFLPKRVARQRIGGRSGLFSGPVEAPGPSKMLVPFGVPLINPQKSTLKKHRPMFCMFQPPPLPWFLPSSAEAANRALFLFEGTSPWHRTAEGKAAQCRCPPDFSRPRVKPNASTVLLGSTQLPGESRMVTRINKQLDYLKEVSQLRENPSHLGKHPLLGKKMAQIFVGLLRRNPRLSAGPRSACVAANFLEGPF